MTQRQITPLTLVLTFSGALERQESARSQLEKIDWPFQFQEGFHIDDPAAGREYDPEANAWWMKRPLTHGEIAVYAGHRKALRTFLSSGACCCLILEDDFGILDPDSFARQIAEILAAPAAWDIVKLFDFEQKNVAERLSLGHVELVSYDRPTAGMVGYLITRDAAKRILSRRRFFRQIDEDTKYYWELDLRVFSAHPNLVCELSENLGGSLLETERHTVRRDRNVKRSLKGMYLSGYRKLLHHVHRSRYSLLGCRRERPLDSDQSRSAY
ncbi:glycosyltransferase family 25 protein [Terrihabitans sp. B22-R8]|uniref:glycosyltransferase family 25 protein n=1 Tax=Terrihabitans sp. B22-R8 TaxID=3425128 RepID=UPI00403CF483